MSTPDQPDTPSLTRKQLRELRNTGATPVVSPSDTPQEPKAPVAPLPRPAEPVVVPPPVADASVDLGVSPLTRRQARQQERIRTASVPVITPDVVAEHAAVAQPVPAAVSEPGHSIFKPWAKKAPAPQPEEVVDDTPPHPVADDEETRDEASDEGPVVDPNLGAEILAGEPVAVSFPPSFDQLISRSPSTTGSVATPNALILSQDPAASALGPVTATGEILVTGTFALPTGLGATGHAPGVADGKEADAVLIDGELPAASSPTPIAASAAISTVKSTGDIIRPPAPEKGSRLLLTLAITAGALALALVGALVVAVSSGVFS